MLVVSLGGFDLTLNTTQTKWSIALEAFASNAKGDGFMSATQHYF